MLVTEINIILKAGDGGNGKLSFYKKRRGPDGGNGGSGASIYASASTDIYSLRVLKKTAIIEAENGQHGMAGKKNGRNADDLDIKLPLGTVITDKDSKVAYEIASRNDRYLLCRGGNGGLGNWEYRSSTNVTPLYAQYGSKGQQREFYINLKLIADFGFIGYPNAGKSSLLKELTKAEPKIGNYPFTTLEPNLGELDGKILADIPGLIEGASEGKGLGIKFLKHIEKVSLIFHCISCELENPKKSYLTIRDELKKFNPKLLDIPEIILLTKTDLKSAKDVQERLGDLKSLKVKILPTSIYDWDSLEKLRNLILKTKP